MVSATRPKFYHPRLSLSLINQTRSPSSWVSFAVDRQVCRLFNIGRYSIRNLSQMRFAHCLNGKYTFLLSIKKWFGVNASKSLASELTGIYSLAFNVCSTIHIVVERTSSVSDLFPNTVCIAFLLLLANRSNTHPKWGAPGGLNFHLISCWIRFSSISSLLHAPT